VQSNALSEEECFKAYRTCVWHWRKMLMQHAGFLKTDRTVWTSLGTANTSCKISVIMAMNYLVFAAQQDYSIAMVVK